MMLDVVTSILTNTISSESNEACNTLGIKWISKFKWWKIFTDVYLTWDILYFVIWRCAFQKISIATICWRFF